MKPPLVAICFAPVAVAAAVCVGGVCRAIDDKKPSHVVVRVSAADALRPAEVAVAVNPMRPEHLVAVFQQRRQTPPGSANQAAVSDDGGLTWKDSPLPNVPQRGEGDDYVTFGPDGTAYRACVTFNGLGQNRPARANSGIYVASSKDGHTWNSPVAVIDHVNTVEPFEDKPGLIVDHGAQSPHKGTLYATWTRFDAYKGKDPAHRSHVYISRSRDGAKSFSPALRISDKPGDCSDSSGTVMGAMPAVGPGGEVYVVWAGPDGILFDKSSDGGATFGVDQLVSKSPGGWDIPTAGLARHNGCPSLGVDHSSGAQRGSIYVCWIDRRHGDPDVFLAASRDGGATWSEPVRVNDDEIGNGKDQLFAWMAVDPLDGAINVVFYDRRGLDEAMTGVTMARSTDGGRSFVNHRINQEPFLCHKDVFLGDYIGIAATQGRVVALYSHFVGRRELAISAAVFRFKPGTQEPQ
jgi:hypothetical protein